MRFPVSREKEEALEKRLLALGIQESDFEEKFIRSQGPGGQNVNKLSTCVVLTHLSTGIQVRCQYARSQGLNRYFARKILADKVEKQVLGVRLEEEKERFKVRKQKKRRSRRTKIKLKKIKEVRQEKKTFRLPVREES